MSRTDVTYNSVLSAVADDMLCYHNFILSTSELGNLTAIKDVLNQYDFTITYIDGSSTVYVQPYHESTGSGTFDNMVKWNIDPWSDEIYKLDYEVLNNRSDFSICFRPKDYGTYISSANAYELNAFRVDVVNDLTDGDCVDIWLDGNYFRFIFGTFDTDYTSNSHPLIWIIKNGTSLKVIGNTIVSSSQTCQSSGVSIHPDGGVFFNKALDETPPLGIFGIWTPVFNESQLVGDGFTDLGIWSRALSDSECDDIRVVLQSGFIVEEFSSENTVSFEETLEITNLDYITSSWKPLKITLPTIPTDYDIAFLLQSDKYQSSFLYKLYKVSDDSLVKSSMGYFYSPSFSGWGSLSATRSSGHPRYDMHGYGDFGSDSYYIICYPMNGDETKIRFCVSSIKPKDTLSISGIVPYKKQRNFSPLSFATKYSSANGLYYVRGEPTQNYAVSDHSLDVVNGIICNPEAKFFSASSGRATIYKFNELTGNLDLIQEVVPPSRSSASYFGGESAISSDGSVFSSIGKYYGQEGIYIFEYEYDNSNPLNPCPAAAPAYRYVYKAFFPADIRYTSPYHHISTENGVVVFSYFDGDLPKVKVIQKISSVWEETADLYPWSITSDYSFDSVSVDTDGTYVVIGNNHDNSGTNIGFSGTYLNTNDLGPGRVYVYELADLTNPFQIIDAPQQLSIRNTFGYDVRISNNTIVVLDKKFWWYSEMPANSSDTWAYVAGLDSYTVEELSSAYIYELSGGSFLLSDEVQEYQYNGASAHWVNAVNFNGTDKITLQNFDDFFCVWKKNGGTWELVQYLDTNDPSQSVSYYESAGMNMLGDYAYVSSGSLYVTGGNVYLSEDVNNSEDLDAPGSSYNMEYSESVQIDDIPPSPLHDLFYDNVVENIDNSDSLSDTKGINSSNLFSINLLQSESILTNLYNSISDSFTVDDLLSLVSSFDTTIIENINIAEDVLINIGFVIQEMLSISESESNSMIMHRIINEDVNFNEVIILSFLHVISDGLSLNESIVPIQTIQMSLSDSNTISTVINDTIYFNISIDEIFEVYEDLYRFFSVSASDSIATSESLLNSVYMNNVIEEIINVSESNPIYIKLFAVSSDDFEMLDSNIANCILNTSVSDDFILTSIKITSNNSVYSGWVLNPENFAVSTYSNYNFNSLIEWDGEYYGLNSSGIWKLDGTLDDSSYIQAKIVTAAFDFDTSNQKTVPEMYLGYTANGNLVLKVSKDDDVTVYFELSTTNDGLSTGTIKLSKGMVGRYFQYELISKNSTDFGIDTIEFYPVVFGRKR